MRRIFIILFVMLLACGDTIAQRYPFQVPYLPTIERARDLTRRLTLDERISLMTDHSPAIERFKIPEFDWWGEASHGIGLNDTATVFPVPIAMAASFDDKLVYNIFKAVSDEARAKNAAAKASGHIGPHQGLVFLVPDVNIFRDPRWGGGLDTYGEDPYVIQRMGLAVVAGMQGTEGARYKKTLACLKDFAVYSGPAYNHSLNIQNLSARDLWETYLPPFMSMVKDGKVGAVMCSPQRLDNEPCCGNSHYLEQILRKEWGFEGPILSSPNALNAFWQTGYHGYSTDATDAAAKAIIGGTDLEFGDTVFRLLPAAITAQKVKQAQVDENCAKMLAARFSLCDFDEERLNPYNRIQKSVIASKRHREMALKMARESMVLLQNWNNALPLSRTDNDIVVMGPNANDSVMLLGNHPGKPLHTVTILEGLREKNANIKFVDGCGITSNKGGVSNDDLLAKVGSASKVIFVGGLSPQLEGGDGKAPGFSEGDRTSIELPQIQRDMIKKLHDAGKTVIFVNCSGSAVGLEPEADNTEAIVQAWYPGEQGGKAVADVLYGDFNPSGKLPVTFYRHDSDLPDFSDYSMANRTYRYFKGDALFPFGYGLSYSTFKVVPQEFKNGHLMCNVTNTGAKDGAVVVQMYIARPGDTEGPSKTLRGFKRVDLKAGETRLVEVAFTGSAELQLWDAATNTMKFIPGDYDIYIGTSSKRSELKKYAMTISQALPPAEGSGNIDYDKED